MTTRYDSYRVARRAIVERNDNLRFLARRDYLEEDMRGVAKSEVEQAKEALEKFEEENERFQGFFLSVLKKNLNDVEENISFLQEVYDEVRDQPYDDDSERGRTSLRLPGGVHLPVRRPKIRRAGKQREGILANHRLCCCDVAQRHPGCRGTRESPNLRGRKASCPTPCGRRGRGLIPFFGGTKMETKTKELQDRGGQDEVWVKLAVPATGKFRDGLVAVADQTGVARSAIYHLALRRGLASLQEKSVDARDLMGLLPSLDFRRGKRSRPKTSGRGKS